MMCANIGTCVRRIDVSYVELQIRGDMPFWIVPFPDVCGL
jgi:hypothetical protein